jgi:hypothetical protein
VFGSSRHCKGLYGHGSSLLGLQQQLRGIGFKMAFWICSSLLHEFVKGDHSIKEVLKCGVRNGYSTVRLERMKKYGFG